MPSNSRSSSTTANTTVVDDFPFDTSTTGRVSPSGTPATGNIQFAGDKDLFAIDLMAGVSYDLTLYRDSKSGVDPMLSLHNTSGKMVAHDTGGKSADSAHLYFTPSTSGTYYLGAQDQNGTGTGSYTLQATAIDDVPYNTTELMPVGTTTSGRIEVASDTDRYAVELTAGSTYVFTLESDKTAAGLDPRLQLSSKGGGKNGGGSKIAVDDDSGNPHTGAARIRFTASSSGTYYLDAMGEDGTAGGYLLTAKVLGAGQAPAATAGHEMLDIAALQDIALVGVASGTDGF